MSARAWWAQVRRAFAEEWHGTEPVRVSLESDLARERSRAVAREVTDRGMLTALRLVHERQKRTLAVDGRDLESLDAVIETLAARCPEQDDERSTA